MKTIIFSLTTILVLSYTSLLAVNPSATKEKNTFSTNDVRPGLSKEIMPFLAPATPSEATFEDADGILMYEISGDQMQEMAPVTPKEASFEEGFSIDYMVTRFLSPLTPQEATFDDSIGK